MKTKAIFPAILLPGPCVAAYTIRIHGKSTLPNGNDVEREATIQGTGEPDEVCKYLNADYSLWYPILGEEITIDYGKGPIKRVLSESFGKMYLEGR